jgi:hypothetical protein
MFVFIVSRSRPLELKMSIFDEIIYALLSLQQVRRRQR